MTPTQVVGAAVGAFGRRSEGLVDLLAEVGSRALEEVGRRPVDLLVVGNMAGSVLGGVENVAPKVAARLGLEGTAALRVDGASASGAAAFHAAVWAVASGQHDRALVVAGEKMTGLPNAEVGAILSHSLAAEEQSVGATMLALAALVAECYRTRHGADPAAFDAVSVAARTAAAQNPNAQFRTPVTAEEVRQSRPVASPLRLLHASAISDGAAAVVIERGEGAATVAGLGQAVDTVSVADRIEATTFRATRLAAQRAYGQARWTRKDLDFAELHDAFAPFALIDLEDIGACGSGEAGRWFLDGWTRPDGRFPVNPSGGILGRGHPVGASGLAQIAEVVRQLSGTAGPLAIAGPARRALTQSIGGLGAHVFVTLLGRNGG
ncbi:MAG TPA: hypothetical protein VFF67_09770 [Thermoplasmata archaeon]|nr:hypothetical protein [Thermoplasmata archaeon]